ncbi:MAG: response regulator transcription factor [Anaerolineales bacterium]|nr:response regulator transcription factor [Anaerolineales bacterium]
MSALILVVDDEPRYVRLMEANLVSAGYTVLTANNGQDAIGIVDDQRPNLVLLDVMMPELDGLQACERIRKFSNVPIIMVTARGDERDRVRGLDVGADDYIVKPYSVTELLARVRAVLRRAQFSDSAYSQSVFTFEQLRVDFARAEVFLGDTEILLSATEYRLLLQFIHHQGQILSSEALLGNVWGEAYRDDKEVLWVSISRLRQKLEDNPKKPLYIVTRQGLGYTMPYPE